MLACYDVDGTLANGMLIIPLMISEHIHGILNENTFTKLNSIIEQYKNGKVSYEITAQQLLETHAAGLKNYTQLVLEAHADEFIKQNTALFRPFGKDVIDLLRPNFTQVIVTTEPQYLAKAIANYYNADKILSTQYEIIDGRFTGRISSSLASRKSKFKALKGHKVAYAFGDSESDIEMLQMSANAYCINPTDGLRKIGIKSGWKIYDGNDSEITKDIQLRLSSKKV
jgi:HAD superfamily phosphoserine phosphatase-like hydrolase